MPNYQQLHDGNSDGAQLGVNVSDKVALFGTTPISQRAAAAQATSLVGTASSTDVTTDLKAALIEVMNTLTNLGAWKGGA